MDGDYWHGFPAFLGLCFNKIYEYIRPKVKIVAMPIILPSIATVKDCVGVMPMIKTENTIPEKLQNIRVNKIPIDIELKPDTHIYYVMLRPGNITGEFSIYVSLTSEDSFDFYIFDKKEDIRDSTAKPISTFLLMKNLNRTFPVEEGNVMVLANSRDKTVNILGMVEYTK